MYDIKHDVEPGLFINGERCSNDSLAQCSSNTGNILVTYDTSSLRVKSPETISSSNSDVIILGNGIAEKMSTWSISKDTEFTTNLRGLRTPSPGEIVSQWLEASPACKTLEKTRTILVERTVQDEEESTPRLKSSAFEIFDLGTNRLNKTSPNQNTTGIRISPNPTSPETRRKQELCSYLQLMNMNSKSDKQRSKIRSNFNRRSNRVKNLIVQIEKRKLEEQINKEIKLNPLENVHLIHEMINLRRKSILSDQTMTDLVKDVQPSQQASILQGFTPSLMPVKVRKRRVAFDIVMRRFITNESITVKDSKYFTSINTDDGRSDITSTSKQGRTQKLKENYNPLKRSSTTISGGDVVPVSSQTKRLKDAAISNENMSDKNIHIKSKLNISQTKNGKKYHFDEAISTVKLARPKLKAVDDARSELTMIKANSSSDIKKDKIKICPMIVKLERMRIVKSKINENKKRIKRRRYKPALTLFEKEIVKISRLSRWNVRSRVHNLRVQNNRLKHKENVTNENKNSKENVAMTNTLVENVLKAKQGSSVEHRNNGVNKEVKINEDYKKVTQVEIVKNVETSRDISSSRNSENKSQLQSFKEKEIEIVDLSAISIKVNKTNPEISSISSPIKETKMSAPITKPYSPIKIINSVKDATIEPLRIEEILSYLNDHTYAQYTKEIFDNQDEQENNDVDNQLLDFRGFNTDEQNISNRVLNLAFAAIVEIKNSSNVSIKKLETSSENTRNENLSNTTWNNNDSTEFEAKKGDSSNKPAHAVNEDSGPVEIEENAIIEHESSKESTLDIYNELSEKAEETANKLNEVIHYNMHDYDVPGTSDSSSSNEHSSASSSVYSERSLESNIENNSPSLHETEYLNPTETTNQEIQKHEVCLEEKEIEKPIGIITPKVTEPTKQQFHPDKILIIQTEPPLDFAKRPVTPPTYIPFVAQNKSPSKTLHRNLTNSNNYSRRKIGILHQPQLASPSNISSQNPPSNNLSSHCATISPTDGRLLHAEYCTGQLVASQERLITCWAQTPLGHILHSQELWIARGVVVRQQFGEDSVLKNMKNRIMIVDNVVSYVEIWVKEHKSVFRERPVADVFAVIYSWKPNQAVEKKLVQLENIKGSADDVQCIILKKSRSVLVSWSIMQSAIKQATVLHLCELSPDYQRVLTIKELKSIETKIQSLHIIEDSDDLVIGCGENYVNIWNVEHGYIVATLDMPDILPEPRCLWTLCNQGFVFLLQECNDGLLRLIAINGIKMKITWKNLKIFNPPNSYYNLLGVCLENGILVSCYENGMLSWNVQTSELLTEEPLPIDDMSPFTPPYCFLSDNHLIQLERNGQIQVRHVLYHLLTSSDLSM